MHAEPRESRVGSGEPDVGQVAAVIGEPSRARILALLTDAQPHSASEIADAVGISRPSTTAQLRRLLDAGLIRVEQRGRHRYHSIAGRDVARLVEAMSALTPRAPVTSLRQATKTERLRAARSCYDHAAGQFGVQLTQALRAADVIEYDDAPVGSAPGSTGGAVSLGINAPRVLARLDVDLEEVRAGSPRRPLARLCIDWSERQPHLAGSLGAAVLSMLLEHDWVRRRTPGRELTVTDAGEARLSAILGR